jgi:MFS transporter, ACS family, glucarate transporter
MAVDIPPELLSNRATQTRFHLAFWLCGLSAILYLDRICMSQAVVPIQKELGLSNTQISYVLMAFSLAYGLFEIPTGRMGDRFGSRRILTRIVIWWSVFTALTGAATGFISLLLIRFMFGIGEAGAFPNAARVISRWFPVQERGRVQGLMLAFAQFGAVIAPVGAAYLIETIGWKWSFGVFGLIGIAWAIGFWFWFRDNPAEHSGVNSAELLIIQGGQPSETLQPGPIPWKSIITNRGIIILSMIMILGAFFTYFFYSWFPKYLSAARGLENIYAGRLSSLVLAGSALGMLFGGWLADKIPKWTNDPILARRFLGAASYFSAAICLFFGIRCDDPLTLATLWGASFCAMHITLPNWWSVAIPQCGRHVGAIFGLMNGVGVIGAMSSQWFVGAFSDWRGSMGYTGREQWDPMFDVYVGVLVLGGIAWWFYRFRPLEPEAHTLPIGVTE